MIGLSSYGFGLGFLHVPDAPSNQVTFFKGDPILGAASVVVPDQNSRRYSDDILYGAGEEIVYAYFPEYAGSQCHADGAEIQYLESWCKIDFTSVGDRDNYDSDAAYVTIDTTTTGFNLNIRQHDGT